MNLVLILSATHQIKKRPAHREVFCLTIFDAVLAFYSFAETRPAIVTNGEYFSNNSKNLPTLFQL